ncbi:MULTISPECIES: thiamine phosphate synthase [Chryseobacterium]|uniref:Thiamine-phosphate pyrophosphorylase n=1 Tax=Chryseobacterium camelliae TaxID=1265445 RepID=A0ABU0TLR4_9FLAO|nr:MULTISPECIES: thiamine phosphate synthase [Chryseobacterium]MDT3408160.1 thiamine-phosphate pyrophosphorylase [Pseudacidovorax intermedius]MDQ1097984.1 thiamine-phosphate pyrophosphorylase [Chryseobacterium camelliae]MDQ1101913.1 thiamine-phosphate pyrophosphorylase [Chryseobacterium sp. SORGH_AS_1048]MDR6085353.1 thiamine-phosphate pyrophosphorylase [Chryseobacterium sp. SORGH_AS_0909]MDR6129712.1 thiamine-phosphate pyrophosphorylase [Chryseobacterium sp. SORGH_AS_1175]
MILVITPENQVQNEILVINQLFREKLDLLHVRKPGMNVEAMRKYISQINPDYHSQIVLHSHYSLAEEFGIYRLHFREADRNNVPDHFFDEYVLSTSVHTIDCFNELAARWEYAFISPVFPSISKKGYGTDSEILESIQYRKNDRSGLIALGGISQHNIDAVFTEDVDGAALLGAVWQSEEPIQVYTACRQRALSL